MKVTTEFDLLSSRTSDRKTAEVLVIAGSVIVMLPWKRNHKTEKKGTENNRHHVSNHNNERIWGPSHMPIYETMLIFMPLQNELSKYI